MRRATVTALTALLTLVPVSAASADHTGCSPHQRTEQAHQSVPHKDNHGTHQAHGSIPYCPPADAPRHQSP